MAGRREVESGGGSRAVAGSWAPMAASGWIRWWRTRVGHGDGGEGDEDGDGDKDDKAGKSGGGDDRGGWIPRRRAGIR